jgi:hypothetical protein
MALLNFTYAVLVPFVFACSIPLAFFATLTTTFAFTVLLLRVLVVYVELALAIIPFYLLGIASPKPSLERPRSSASFHTPVPSGRRKRRSSSNSTESLTPIVSDANLGLSQSIGPQRDFEGVGGWRLDAPSEDDFLWTSFNSRLELPADHVRRHRRSLTSGSQRFREDGSNSPENRMHSPNTSRARTPPSNSAPEQYFPTMPGGGSPNRLKKMSSNMTVTSGSSVSSKSSGGLSMKGR